MSYATQNAVGAAAHYQTTAWQDPQTQAWQNHYAQQQQPVQQVYAPTAYPAYDAAAWQQYHSQYQYPAYDAQYYQTAGYANVQQPQTQPAETPPVAPAADSVPPQPIEQIGNEQPALPPAESSQTAPSGLGDQQHVQPHQPQEAQEVPPPPPPEVTTETAPPAPASNQPDAPVHPSAPTPQAQQAYDQTQVAYDPNAYAQYYNYYYGQQYSAQQYPAQQYPAQQYPAQQYPTQQYYGWPGYVQQSYPSQQPQVDTNVQAQNTTANNAASTTPYPTPYIPGVSQPSGDGQTTASNAPNLSQGQQPWTQPQTPAKPTYNTAPPPASLANNNSTNDNSSGGGILIRPQWGKKYSAMTSHSGPPTSYASSSPAQTSAASSPYSVHHARPSASIPAPPAYMKAQATNQNLASPEVTTKPAGYSTPSQQKSTSAAGSSQSAGSSKYPPGLAAYVERCFACCKNEVEREAMKARVTTQIKECEASGRLWLTDWDINPIPNLAETKPKETYRQQESKPQYQGTPQYHLPKRARRWEEEEENHNDQRFYNKKDKTKGKKGKAFGEKQQEPEKDSPVPYRAAYSEGAKRVQRAGRFNDGMAPGVRNSGSSWQSRLSFHPDTEDQHDDSDTELQDAVPVRGTCMELEKSYFRLTCAPDPNTVRPEPVLRRALAHIIGLLRQGTIKYLYACDQFKGMRQDLTVQHLRNALSAEVYEAHARAALEYGDMPEFNQCQTQLAALYAEGIPGCRAEFVAYKLLYQTAHSRSGLKKALLATMKAIPQDLTSNPVVQHAMKVRAALMVCDYSTYFQLYASAPNMGRALMDMTAPKVRWAALNVLVKAFTQTPLPVAFLARVLGFAPLSASGAREVRATPPPGCKDVMMNGQCAPAETMEDAEAACITWLVAHGAVMKEEANGALLVDCKASAGKLFIPEDTSKVAHGDANLALDDFLTSAAVKASNLWK